MPLMKETPKEARVKCGDNFDDGMCPVENERRKTWIKEHAKTCSLTANAGGDLTMTAAHQICLRMNSMGNSVVILCDCGDKIEVSHWEHM